MYDFPLNYNSNRVLEGFKEKAVDLLDLYNKIKHASFYSNKLDWKRGSEFGRTAEYREFVKYFLGNEIILDESLLS